MISCPNKRLKVWKDLVKNVGEDKAYLLWSEYDGFVPDSYYFTINEPLLVEKPRLIDLLDENADNFLEIIDENTDEVAEEIKNEFILFNNEDKSFTAKEVLDNIKRNYTGFNEFTLKLLDKLLPLLYNTNAKIKFVKSTELKSYNTVMQYKPLTNEILISKDRLADFDLETVISSFLHEATHSVTIKAYSRPEGMTEKMFKDFIDEMYIRYQEVGNNDLYGFKNQMEFIAELMTNEEFQSEIKTLDKGSLWKQFVDYLRTLLGLPKNKNFNDLVDSITNIITEDTYEGGINEIIYEKRAERTYYELSSIEKKQAYIVNNIKDNVEESIRRYDALVKKLKDPTKLAKHSDKLKELFKEIESFDKAKEWQAIATFTHSLANNIQSLTTKFKGEDLSAPNIKNIIGLYEKYLTAHSLVDEISQFMSDYNAEDKDIISKEEVFALKDMLSVAQGQYTTLTNDINAMKKKGVIKVLNDRKYAAQVMARWKTKLEKQHKDLNISENKASWVARMMNNTYKDEIDADVEEYVNGVVNNVHFDISTLTGLFVSGISTNSKLVQIMQNLINTVRENIIRRDRDNDFELKSLFDKWIGEKGNISPSKAFANIIEYGKGKKAYLKGEYKIEFRETYEAKLNEYKTKREETINKFGKNSTEFRKFYINSDFKKWTDKNTVQSIDDNGSIQVKPIDSWKNDLSKLSAIEKETLDKFIKITNDTKKQTFGMQSLVSKSLFGATYYSLPSITKSNLERVVEGNVKGIVNDAWKDLTEIRPDDVGFETIKSNLAGKPIYDVKINFRGDIDYSQQSLDLFTVYRLEAKNGVNFEEKHNVENDMTSLVEISKNASYYKTANSRVPFVNKLLKRNPTARIEGKDSNTYKRMVSLMESNLYDILHKDAGKIGKVDMNKAVGLLNGWTAKLGMWVNEVAGTVNILNGKAQLFLEAIAGNHIKGGSLAKAEKLYFQDILNNLKDVRSPIKTSLSNQLNEIFDTFGMISVSAEQAFIKNTILKAKANEDTMQFIQSGGEHWLQSVLTMGVLDSIKVMDINNNFIDKTGKIVEEKDGATLLDMFEKIDGKLVLSDKVIYTDKTPGIKYNEGGKQAVTAFLKAKIFATMGNYDSNMQPEAMRHASGKIIMMFRKYLIELGLNRWRGLEHFYVAKGDLLEEEKFFSEALQEDVEGMYTTTLRYIANAVYPAIRNLNFKLLSSNWNELTDTEKKNIHKTIAETAMNIILYQMAILLAGFAGDDDDDNSALYFSMLVTARLNSELSSYIDPRQQYKILKSPIPSMRIVQSLTSIAGTILMPHTIGDRDSKGALKIGKNLEQLVPIMNLRRTSYKQKFQYINYVTN